MYRFQIQKICFLQFLDDLHFKYIFHNQSGSESGSEIKVKVRSGSDINNFGSTTLPPSEKLSPITHISLCQTKKKDLSYVTNPENEARTSRTRRATSTIFKPFRPITI
jgi:hypothetical protein